MAFCSMRPGPLLSTIPVAHGVEGHHVRSDLDLFLFFFVEVYWV